MQFDRKISLKFIRNNSDFIILYGLFVFYRVLLLIYGMVSPVYPSFFDALKFIVQILLFAIAIQIGFGILNKLKIKYNFIKYVLFLIVVYSLDLIFGAIGKLIYTLLNRYIEMGDIYYPWFLIDKYYLSATFFALLGFLIYQIIVALQSS